MSRLRKKMLTFVGGVALLLACLCPANGQFARSRRVRVYNPGAHTRTRAATSRRAAPRKVKSKRQRAATRRGR
jgi:hypothetical protein